MAPSDATTTTNDPEIKLTRGTIDKLLVGVGTVAALVLVIAGGLLTWGANFSNDYVRGELEAQNVFFPTAEALKEEGRDDLVEFAEQQVLTGKQAEQYASYIQGHLDGMADGKTYSQIPDRAAKQAVADAIKAGEDQATIDELQKEADRLTALRDTLFKGETLRGLLLTSYAWSTIGQIAGIAAWVTFAAAALMAILTIAGIVHIRKQQ